MFSVDENCFDVTVLTVMNGKDVEWHIGTCNSLEITYQETNRYLHRCCLQPGEYLLTCINKRNPYGWNHGYIEIQGHRYCDDFLSYKSMQKITIKSMNSLELC